jgi:2-polyprenyl-6-methoxyphenol hydroxylase-like FAD-dependent oxidoreductase
MMRADETDVIIVGAGPTGLTLALGLARAGRRVLVLERDATTAEHSRAPAIWPRAQQIMAILGVLDAFVTRGITLPTLRLHDADAGDDVDEGALLTLPVYELAGATPFPRLLILPQSQTERLLWDAVRAQPTAEVRFGAEVIDVAQNGDSVRVRCGDGTGGVSELGAAFVAGCDGGRSIVRECIGATFGGETYDTRAALADIVPACVPDDLPFPRLSTRDGIAVGIRMDALVWRLILPIGAGDERPLDERIERAAAHLFPAVRTSGDYTTVWQSEFRLHRRLASRFVDGRIVLAGDAAHLNSPVGGQGMNAGILDADVLTKALLRALATDDVAALRDYEQARMSAVPGVNRFTDTMTRLLLFGRGRAIRLVLAGARAALQVPRLRKRFLRRLAMLDD